MWSYLIDLQELNVSHNPLEELPAEMFTANIVKLVANSCPFKELPSFGEGCVLEELFLENGSCEIIPGTIGRVLRLKTLKLAGSQVQHIPKTAVFCKELVTFDMGGIKMGLVPEALRMLHTKNVLKNSSQARREIIRRALAIRTPITDAAQTEIQSLDLADIMPEQESGGSHDMIEGE